MQMQMLYDSDNFCVVHCPPNAVPDGEVPEPGFEIVDKRVNKEVYLKGSWAEAFQRQIDAWKSDTPTQDAVEVCLDCYCELAQIPVVIQ